MNNLKTTDTGGFPLVLDDLRWQHEAYKEAFKGILSAFGISPTQTFILSGCVRTVDVGTVTVTEGYVCIEGEVYYMPEQVYAETVDTEYFAVNVTYDPAGLKLFQDASSHDTYEIRQAQILVSDTPPAEHTTPIEAQTIFEVIQDNLPQKANLYKSTGGGAPPLPGFYELGDILVHNDTTVYIRVAAGWETIG